MSFAQRYLSDIVVSILGMLNFVHYYHQIEYLNYYQPLDFYHNNHQKEVLQNLDHLCTLVYCRNANDCNR